MAPEATMIIIDNSPFAPKDSDAFKTQYDAIRLYCRAKIKSNPENSVGAALFGVGSISHFLCAPSSDIEHFLTDLEDIIPIACDFDVCSGITGTQFGFVPLPEDTKKRMLMFFGSSAICMKDTFVRIGTKIKESNVALDVVSFADKDPEFDLYKTDSLKAFVAAANKDNNSHFAHVPPHSSARDILLSSNILTPLEAEAVPLTDEEIKKKLKRCLEVVPLTEEEIKKKIIKQNPQDLEEEAVFFSPSS